MVRRSPPQERPVPPAEVAVGGPVVLLPIVGDEAGPESFARLLMDEEQARVLG
jgi:hypothetical protein